MRECPAFFRHHSCLQQRQNAGASNRFGAVHAFRTLPEGLVAWAVARLTFRPIVIYAHGEELTTCGRGNKYRAMRFVLKHCDLVIANSEHMRDTLLSMGVEPTHITVIYPGGCVCIQAGAGHYWLARKLGNR